MGISALTYTICIIYWKIGNPEDPKNFWLKVRGFGGLKVSYSVGLNQSSHIGMEMIAAKIQSKGMKYIHVPLSMDG